MVNIKIVYSNIFFKLFIALAIIVASGWSKSFNIDKSHSSVGFTVKHLLVSDVQGVFKDYDINFEMDDSAIKKFDLKAEVKSVDTRNQRRDDDLLSDNFFDAKRYSKITFHSTGYKASSPNQGKLSGNLTIRDITEKLVLNVTISDPVKFRGKDVYGVKITGELNRKDFKVGSGFPSAVVSEDVKLEVNLEVSK